MDKISFRLNSYFINKKAFHLLFSSSEGARLRSILSQLAHQDEFSKSIHTEGVYTKAAVDLIRRKGIISLREALLLGKLNVGTLIAGDETFYFKKVKAAQDRIFHAKFSDFKNIQVKGEFHSRHFTCQTAYDRLSKRARIFILGYVQKVSPKTVVIKPIMFSDRVLYEEDRDSDYGVNLRIDAEEIDEFSSLSKITYEKMIKSYGKNAFYALKEIPEVEIKKYFADIIFESNIPKDWGGESSDLYTTHLHINGGRIHAAFLFKGPSKFHIMKLKDLGVNGDQIVRLFDEEADLYVLQHCHYISSSVYKNMEAFASSRKKIKKYMVIDGPDTFRILKAYKKI